jgi:hypothetical protein
MSTSHNSSTDSRKAEKKLREIDKLKQKSVHTKEEIEKLKTETYYRRIVNPFYKSEEEKQEEFIAAECKRKEIEELKQRQYARHLEKEKRRQQKKNKEREKKEKEMEKERAERNKSYSEKEKRERDEKRHRFDFTIKPQIKPDTNLEIEYYSLLKKHENNNDKTFRVLSKKYHPDRNLDNKEWAENQQKQLLEIREYIRGEVLS